VPLPVQEEKELSRLHIGQYHACGSVFFIICIPGCDMMFGTQATTGGSQMTRTEYEYVPFKTQGEALHWEWKCNQDDPEGARKRDVIPMDQVPANRCVHTRNTGHKWAMRYLHTSDRIRIPGLNA
jgi:hypothetical protein